MYWLVCRNSVERRQVFRLGLTTVLNAVQWQCNIILNEQMLIQNNPSPSIEGLGPLPMFYSAYNLDKKFQSHSQVPRPHKQPKICLVHQLPANIFHQHCSVPDSTLYDANLSNTTLFDAAHSNSMTQSFVGLSACDPQHEFIVLHLYVSYLLMLLLRWPVHELRVSV